MEACSAEARVMASLAKYGMARLYIPRLTDSVLDTLLVERHDTGPTSPLCLATLRTAMDVLRGVVDVFRRKEGVMEALQYFTALPQGSILFQRYMEDAQAALVKEAAYQSVSTLADGIRCVQGCERLFSPTLLTCL
jgi:hypothetical protein